MKSFYTLRHELTEAVTGKTHSMTGGGAKLKAKSGDAMSFTHHEQGKITGTFHKPIVMGSRTYAGIEHGGYLHAVPVHQVTHVNGKEIKSHIPESVEYADLDESKMGDVAMMVNEPVTAHDKSGKVVGRYKNLKQAIKAKPDHTYQHADSGTPLMHRWVAAVNEDEDLDPKIYGDDLEEARVDPDELDRQLIASGHAFKHKGSLYMKTGKYGIHRDSGEETHEYENEDGDRKWKTSSGKIHESVGEVEEKTLTFAELRKREKVANAIEKQSPGIDMSKKMAIATSVAKKSA
jgi:hypothetical protein